MNPQILNLVLYCGLALGQLPLFIDAAPPDWRALWLGVPVLLTLPTWALLHEAIHGNLHASAPRNRLLGRALAVLYGAPFGALRCGHLLHHRYSRIEDLSETYDPVTTSRAVAVLRHYATILGGLYWAEALVGCAAWLPARWRARLVASSQAEMPRKFHEHLCRPEVLVEIRLDSIAALALLAFSAWLYRDAWLVWCAAVSGRAMLISFFDNAYHYGTAPGRPELARNHRFPVGASCLILHFNFHGVHHLDPTLPWYRLPAHARQLGASFSGGFFSMPLRQLRGPIAIGDLASQTPALRA